MKSGRTLLLVLLVFAIGCSDSSGGGGAASQASLDLIRERLKDRLFEFGRSSGNSDRNAFVTGYNQLQLCGVGLFALKETRSFSSSVGSMTSESMSYGTWTLRTIGAGAVVDLVIERSTEKNPPAAKQFRVEIVGEGVRFDGNATTSEGDVSADCAEAAAQQEKR